MEVEEGFSLAMKLRFQTQCCKNDTNWKDDLITVSDGNQSVLFSQKEGFRLSTEGEVLINSHSNSATLEFCKVSEKVVMLDGEFNYCPPQYISGVNGLPGYSLSYEAVIQPLTLARYDQVRSI